MARNALIPVRLDELLRLRRENAALRRLAQKYRDDIAFEYGIERSEEETAAIVERELRELCDGDTSG